MMEVTNALSVDLEDWYQAVTSLNARPEAWDQFEKRVTQNTERLLEIFAQHQVQVTFFILGRVAEEYPDLIEKIVAAGHEVGVHGHLHRMVSRLTPDEFQAELESALKALEPLVAAPILGHRAPYFSINGQCLWALDVLQEMGFRYDSSFFATRNVLYGYPGSPAFPHRPEGLNLVEFPLATANWAGIRFPIAGGFYLRSLPYAITRQGIRQLNRQGQPAVLYLHPWEIDSKHRYNQVTAREWIVQYTGRGGMEKKLHRLLSDFKFAPLCHLLRKFDDKPGQLKN